MNASEGLPGLETFAYVSANDTWFKKRPDGKWDLNTPLVEKAIKKHMAGLGWTRKDIEDTIKNHRHLTVEGFDMVPYETTLFTRFGERWFNYWVAPKIEPKPGEWPTIASVLDWLTSGDLEGRRWLEHWVARKIQNPELVPKVAVVFSGQQGAGKGFLAHAILQMLGADNCAQISRDDLDSQYNEGWARKLFIHADEIVSNEGHKDITARLKILIDAKEIQAEAKFQHRRKVKNRSAWMFASNDKVLPVMVEQGDRRFSVFTNFEPLSAERTALMRGCFGPDGEALTPSYQTELEAFFHHCLNLKVDLPFVARPYDNHARKVLIESGSPSYEVFITSVLESGIDVFVERAKEVSFENASGLRDWEIPPADSELAGLEGDARSRCLRELSGVTSDAIYYAYTRFCKDSGLRSLGRSKFGTALLNAMPSWRKDRKWFHGRSVYCYFGVPRSLPEAIMTKAPANPNQQPAEA